MRPILSQALGKRFRMIAILAGAAVVLNAPLASAGSVYKWTDENGVTHYSDREPSKGATKLNVSTTAGKGEKLNDESGADENGYSVKPELQSQIDELEKKQKVNAVQSQIDAETAEEMNRNQARCEALRNNLKTIQENARVQVEEAGERRYLTAEELVEKRETIAADLKDNCS